MRHLYASLVEVLQLSGDLVNGTPVLAWTKLSDIVDPTSDTPGELWCRLDLTFVRPGKDQPMPIVAGRAPDRVGLAVYDVTDKIKAGHRLRTLAGPITGTFEIRAIPDPAVGFGAAHHMEVQIIEVAQALQDIFPAGEVTAA